MVLYHKGVIKEASITMCVCALYPLHKGHNKIFKTLKKYILGLIINVSAAVGIVVLKLKLNSEINFLCHQNCFSGLVHTIINFLQEKECNIHKWNLISEACQMKSSRALTFFFSEKFLNC